MKKDCDCGFFIGIAYKKLDDFETAIKSFEKVISIDDNGKVYCELGYIYWNEHKTEKARKYFENSVKVKNPDYNSFFHLAEFYKFIEKYDEAEFYMEKSINKAPKSQQEFLNKKLNDIIYKKEIT